MRGRGDALSTPSELDAGHDHDKRAQGMAQEWGRNEYNYLRNRFALGEAATTDPTESFDTTFSMIG